MLWLKIYHQRTLVLGCMALLLSTGCTSSTAEQNIKDVLNDQTAAWNRGDIEDFMLGYWQSDELTFEAPDSVTKGWQATLERYQRRYPNRAVMGTLAFSNLVVDVTADDEATVTGRFHLERDPLPDASGHFVLTLRRFVEGWRIVRDRTWSDLENEEVES